MAEQTPAPEPIPETPIPAREGRNRRALVAGTILAAAALVLIAGFVFYRFGGLEYIAGLFGPREEERPGYTPFERNARSGSWLLVQGKPDEALARLRETLSLAKTPSEEAYAKTQLATVLFQTEDDPTEAVTLLKEVATDPSYAPRDRAFAFDLLAQFFVNAPTDAMRGLLFGTPPFDGFYDATLSPATRADLAAVRALYEFVQELSPTFLSYLWPGGWYAATATREPDTQLKREFAARALESYRRGSALLDTPEGYLGWAPSVRGKGRLFEAVLTERLAVFAVEGILPKDEDAPTLETAEAKYRDLIPNLARLAARGDRAALELSIAARARLIVFLAAHLPQSTERDREIIAVSDALAATAQSVARPDVVSRLSFLATNPAVIGVPEYTREGARRAAAVAPSFKEVLREYVNGWGQ